MLKTNRVHHHKNKKKLKKCTQEGGAQRPIVGSHLCAVFELKHEIRFANFMLEVTAETGLKRDHIEILKGMTLGGNLT